MNENKIKYGLSNVHVWPITEDNETSTTYGEVIKIPGAVNLSIKAEGGTESFYADNVAYYTNTVNNGYSGSIEFALLPEEIYIKILGAKREEETGVITESADDKTVPFAMAFQFEGDKNSTRHILYKCTATRPAVEGATKADKADPKTESLDFAALPRISDKKIKAKSNTDSNAYNDWFKNPYNKE